MITIKVECKNIKEIEAAFKKSPVEITKRLNVAVGKIVTKMESTTKREAPVNKQSGGGNLRQSIRSRMSGPARGVIEVGALYAEFVHEGTRPHIIRVSRKKVLANRRQGKIFGKVVKHPGTKKNPFLDRAVERERSFINSEFEKVTDNLI